MRFGRELHHRYVLGWEVHYVRYNLLKRLFRAAQQEAQDGGPSQASSEDFLTAISDDLDHVHVVYSGAILELQSRALGIQTSGPSNVDCRPLTPHDAASLIELCRSYQNLRWFLKVNIKAFGRVFDKLARHQLHLGSHYQVVLSRFHDLEAVWKNTCAEHVNAISNDIERMTSAETTTTGTATMNAQGHGERYDHCSPTQVLDALRHSHGLPPRSNCDRIENGVSNNFVSVVQSSNVAAVLFLLEQKPDLVYRNALGETALFVAARAGVVSIVEALLHATENAAAFVDLAETQRGWTPLMVSCIQGHLAVVKLLLNSGARADSIDLEGWTAREHAAFRGHRHIAEDFVDPSLRSDGKTHMRALICRNERPMPDLIHRSHSVILLTVGPSNTRNKAKFVEIDQSMRAQWSIHADCAFSIEITATDARGPKVVMSLPVLEDTINDPIIFQSEHPDRVQLKFDLFRDSGNSDSPLSIVGTGIAPLSSLRNGHSPGREALSRDHTIPILTKDLGAVAAMITFSYLVARPYEGSAHEQDLDVKHGFWKAGGSTQVVGHRGSGKNTAARTTLQLGENTVHSLESAMTLGACAVEFDVQLTKDFVPVIYHNFLVMETGGEATIWNLTKDQFVHLSQSQTSQTALADMAESRYKSKHGAIRSKPRARSVDVYDDSQLSAFDDRMKLTTEAKANGIRGNLRGYSIQGQFPTFQELLTKLPESVSFDLEMKYPMLWEAEDEDWEPYITEANLFVDTVLDMIHEHGGKRNITLSSFSPEICLLLSAKQRAHPILFINWAGQVDTSDTRASSTQDAIQFAKRWNLAGVALRSNPIVMCPRLIRYVRSAGLVCSSWGELNNDPENAKLPPSFFAKRKAGVSEQEHHADAFGNRCKRMLDLMLSSWTKFA